MAGGGKTTTVGVAAATAAEDREAADDREPDWKGKWEGERGAAGEGRPPGREEGERRGVGGGGEDVGDALGGWGGTRNRDGPGDSA